MLKSGYCMRLYFGLVHYPVVNKNDEIIASAITTVDLHDLSRLARTYGVERFFVITPLKDQQVLAERILRHWTVGYGARYNPDRKEAIGLVSIASTLEDAVEEIRKKEGAPPVTIATDASRDRKGCITHARAREIMASEGSAILLFGTAWGLEKSVIEGADYHLEPVEGPTDYNHLSVRAAAAIILDRLRG
ncbi:MAG: RNA methyltransferase, partial [Pseudomonadota bacterium]